MRNSSRYLSIHKGGFKRLKLVLVRNGTGRSSGDLDFCNGNRWYQAKQVKEAHVDYTPHAGHRGHCCERQTG